MSFLTASIALGIWSVDGADKHQTTKERASHRLHKLMKSSKHGLQRPVRRIVYIGDEDPRNFLDDHLEDVLEIIACHTINIVETTIIYLQKKSMVQKNPSIELLSLIASSFQLLDL